MSKRVIWWAVSVLMAISLVAAACAPAAPPTTTPTPAAPPTPVTPTAPVTPTTPAAPAAPAEKEPVKPTSDVPQYGGTLLRAVASDPTAWGPFPGAGNTPLTMQELWGGDWSKGPAGG
ncbi:MAG: hypothetical protein HYX80_09375, partial [Chloroflexi bacterium]|nr:hypothetical protein [Chloroflexota bacterium]